MEGDKVLGKTRKVARAKRNRTRLDTMFPTSCGTYRLWFQYRVALHLPNIFHTLVTERTNFLARSMTTEVETGTLICVLT